MPAAEGAKLLTEEPFWQKVFYKLMLFVDRAWAMLSNMRIKHAQLLIDLFTMYMYDHISCRQAVNTLQCF